METSELVNKAAKAMNGNGKHSHSEGKVAKAIEDQTAKLPSDIFLWSAVGLLGASVVIGIIGLKHVSLFIGQMATPILIMGLYNKVVKVAGSDRTVAGQL
ncbi:MAG: hypothetical protein ACJ76F_07285 [Bacteroidia bacterium]